MNAPEVISLGNMLVEVMRVQLDEPLDRPGTFVGPYPSGDTPIYISTVARLGRASGFIGVVGDDDFGRCLLARFARDGVDFSSGVVLPGAATGVAFVAYFSDGSRTFLFHARDAATGRLRPEHLRADYFQRARWLHLTGTALALSETSCAACYRALELLPAGVRVSFDPNLRPDMLSVVEIRSRCAPLLARADIILPSAGEAALLTGAQDDDTGCHSWAAAGKLVILKRGAHGCRLFEGKTVVDVPGFAVEEVDPTGAGDSFSAGVTVALLDGMPPFEACRFANAVGALAVTQRGPMEGAPTRSEVEAFLSERVA